MTKREKERTKSKLENEKKKSQMYIKKTLYFEEY